jgi:hypothetical protein
MPRASLAALFVALAAGLPAEAAAPPNREQVRFDPADQAAARAALLRRADLGATGWTGGRVKPDPPTTIDCPGYEPKQTDLVLTGAAQADFHHTGIEIRSVVQVLRTRSMVARDWSRSVVDPRAMACMRHLLATELKPGQRLVSFRRLAFPRLAAYSAAYRMLIEVRAQGQRVLVLADEVLIGRNRTELTLALAAPAALKASISQAEIRLARRLLSRVRA